MSISSQDLALLIAGVLAPFVIGVIKGQTGHAGKAALWLAFGVSVVIALFVAVATGTPLPLPGNDPVAFTNEALKLAGVVFTLATLIYKSWLSKTVSSEK